MNINKVLIFSYILVGLIPYFGTADKIHPQTLYISVLNILSLSVLIYSKGIKGALKEFYNTFNQKQVLFFFIYFIAALISILQAINVIQSFITLAEILSQLFAFLILIYFISNLEDVKEFFIKSIVILCIIELVSTIFPYLGDIFRLGYPIDRSLEYRGVSGSVNIISYLLLMKLPFIYYLSIISKKQLRVFYIFISILILYSIIVIHQTRSAILLSFLVSIFLSIAFYFNSSATNSSNSFNLKNIFLTIALPVFLAIFLSNIQSNLFERTENVQDRISTINLEEYSTNARIRYYSQAVNSILSNPLGIGIGNWQLVSIDKDKENIEAYIIPYHVHNDFLEMSAETSLVGGVAYYLMVISVFLFLLRNIYKKIKKREHLDYELLFFTVIGIWLVDSMFNFPSARVLQQITLLYIIAVIINYYKFRPFTLPKYLNHISITVLILSLPVILASSIRLVQSSVDQRILLSHYNLADFSIPLEVIDKMDLEYSDITVTGIPMKSLKGFFYMKSGKYRDALELFNEGTHRNPYLYFSESYKSFSHLNLKNYDSAYYYAKLAFDKMPGNVVHFANYALSLVYKSDSLELKKAYERAKFKSNLHDELYLTAMADIIDEDSNDFALDNFNLNVQSDNDNLKRGYYTLKVGRKDMLEAASLHEIGDYYFKQKNFLAAEEFFKKATDLNPYELVYKENLANNYLQLGKFNIAADILNQLIDEDGSKSVKVKYLRVLAYLNLNDFDTACPYISEIKDEPLVRSLELERFCN